MTEQEPITTETGTSGERREGCGTVVPTISTTVCSRDVRAKGAQKVARPKKPATAACQRCGTNFPISRSQWHRRYERTVRCPPCQKASFAEKRKRHVSAVCMTCGVCFTYTGSAVGSRAKRGSKNSFCSKACSNARPPHLCTGYRHGRYDAARPRYIDLDRRRAYIRTWAAAEAQRLSDSFVRACMRLRKDECPPLLIQAKRAHILLTREVKGQPNESH